MEETVKNEENSNTKTAERGAQKHRCETDNHGFDWIRSRSACSLPKVFKTLRLGVERDVQARNELRPKSAPYEFSVAESESGFKVLLKSDELQLGVILTLAEHAIHVCDHSGQPIFDVTVEFDEKGECRLIVNGEQREPWQVRRMALEDLMFRSL